MDKAKIELTRLLPHPPARVWRALTDPPELAQWWAPGDIAPRVGHRFSFDMGPWGQQPCEVLAAEPERLLSYSFAPSTLGTTVTWTLRSTGIETELTLEHAGFDLDTPLGRQAHQGMGAGWPGVLDRLAALLRAQPG